MSNMLMREGGLFYVRYCEGFFSHTETVCRVFLLILRQFVKFFFSY